MKNRRELFRYAQLLLGSAILAFGLFNVHSQSRITEGGVLGTTLLLQHWFGISPSISEAVLDVCCYLLGLKYLGKSFLRYALTATWAVLPSAMRCLSAWVTCCPVCWISRCWRRW